jgi:UDP-N-acetylmuramoyl-L-alanyl-D-glutamate--2,6-diaminopimelate ligase
MKLADLLTADAVADARFAALDLAGVNADSRAIKPGDLFVAVAGAKDDGLNFVSQALASGAAAIMAERPPATPLPEGVAFIKVDDARRALALTAAKFFSRQPQVIAAVTGTSGKTSVAAFTRQIWTALGHAAASIGTVGLVSPKRER